MSNSPCATLLGKASVVANGSGKTTLGYELAQALKFKHIDVEDYYFEKYGSFVLSGVAGDYGEKIVAMYNLAVLLSAPIDLRMERIRKRANTLGRPIMHLDATRPISQNARKIINSYHTK